MLAEYATVGYMAKRIQMRKQRFMAIQKIAEQKKLQVDGGQPPPGSGGGGGGGGGGGDHGHGHGHGHSHGHIHAPKQTVSSRPAGFSSVQPNVGSRGCSIVGPLFQEVRFKVNDPKAHSKGGTLENTINGGRGGAAGPGGGDRGGGGGGGGSGSGPDEEAGGPSPPHLIHPGKVGLGPRLKVDHIYLHFKYLNCQQKILFCLKKRIKYNRNFGMVYVHI